MKWKTIPWFQSDLTAIIKASEHEWKKLLWNRLPRTDGATKYCTAVKCDPQDHKMQLNLFFKLKIYLNLNSNPKMLYTLRGKCNNLA